MVRCSSFGLGLLTYSQQFVNCAGHAGLHGSAVSAHESGGPYQVPALSRQRAWLPMSPSTHWVPGTQGQLRFGTHEGGDGAFTGVSKKPMPSCVKLNVRMGGWAGLVR